MPLNGPAVTAIYVAVCKLFFPIDKGLHEVKMYTISVFTFKCAYNSIIYLKNSSLVIIKIYPLFIPIFMISVIWYFPFPYGLSIWRTQNSTI